MYINSINYFRGIAIIFIVFGHCLYLADFEYNSIIGTTIFNLTKGGTAFFVFISGFLFHHIFYKKFDYKKFVIKKTKYVLVPYLVLSTLPIIVLLIKVCIDGIFPLNTFWQRHEDLLSFPIFRHYLTGVGESFFGYWYIPFIMIVFAMSPVFIRFIKLRLKTQILITIVLLIISVFLHRGLFQNVFSVFQNVLYYTPIYLIGIIASEKKEIIYSKFKGKEFYLLFLLLVIALFQAYIGKSGDYFKEPFSYNGINLMIFQKILFCFFFMIFLNRFENYKLKLFNIMAENSFGIFFIHGIVIAALLKIKTKFDFSFTSNSFIIYCSVAILVFFLSMVVTLFVKRIFPKYSRYLIGC